jgi:hypothetical protein
MAPAMTWIWLVKVQKQRVDSVPEDPSPEAATGTKGVQVASEPIRRDLLQERYSALMRT